MLVNGWDGAPVRACLCSRCGLSYSLLFLLLLLLLLLSVVVVYFRGSSYGKDGRGCVVVVEEVRWEWKRRKIVIYEVYSTYLTRLRRLIISYLKVINSGTG